MVKKLAGSIPVRFIDVFAKLSEDRIPNILPTNLPSSSTQFFTLKCLEVPEMPEMLPFGASRQWHAIPPALFAQNALTPQRILKERRWSFLSAGGVKPLNLARSYIFPSRKKNPTCTSVTSSSDIASQWNSSFGFVRMGNLHFQVMGLMHFEISISAASSEEGNCMKLWACFSRRGF